MQKHVHAGEVVGGVVDLLPEKAFFHLFLIKEFSGLQKQGAGAAGGVIDFIDAFLLVESQPGNQAGDVLRGEKFSAGFSGVGGVVGDEKFIGVSEEIDPPAVKARKFQPGHSFEDGLSGGCFSL